MFVKELRTGLAKYRQQIEFGMFVKQWERGPNYVKLIANSVWNVCQVMCDRPGYHDNLMEKEVWNISEGMLTGLNVQILIANGVWNFCQAMGITSGYVDINSKLGLECLSSKWDRPGFVDTDIKVVWKVCPGIWTGLSMQILKASGGWNLVKAMGKMPVYENIDTD